MILFSVPSVVTYMALSVGASPIWVLHISLSLFLLSFILDWIGFVLTFSVGSLIGVILFFIFGHENVGLNLEDIIERLVYTSLFSITVSFLFARHREIKAKEKLMFASSVASVIAHQIKHPLFTIGITIEKLQQEQETSLQEKQIATLKKELKSISLMTDIALTKFVYTEDMTTISEKFRISECLNEIMNDYPFNPGEREIVQLNCSNDFGCQGDFFLLKHVFFNLLDNSLYYFRQGKLAKIIIQTILQEEYGVIKFWDNGPGMSLQLIKKVFKAFSTTKSNGHGIGLYFCSQVIRNSFNGTIDIRSEENVFTEFIFKLPKIF